MAKTSRESFKFMLRLPDDLRDSLREAADANGRSVTAEILERLEGSFTGSPSEEMDALKRALAESEHVREIQAHFIETLEGEKLAIGKNAKLSEELALQFALPIQLAAEGNAASLERLVQRAQENSSSLRGLIELLSPPGDETKAVLADLTKSLKATKR